ncbi:hypothetical protein A5681_09840 [Mycobacterium scrofulaceum]|uniref:hypothetical protein n=1 Tax=Mycobacterium scrofulaceum TaxID=1783 RepID=UPI0007FF08C2|nr:hypothetical protein [Mycobacterium scrofulaceum]OBH75930.1 hypothetical protein A5681_09840 [Mycobacterium scrofulaceum]
MTQHRWGTDSFGWIDAAGSEEGEYDGVDFRAKPKDGPTQVRFKVGIAGQAYGRIDVHRGDVVEVPTLAEAQRLYAAGLAQPVEVRELGKPYIPHAYQ